MERLIKIVVSGLDNAGKTSILTALDKKYDFHKDIVSLTPTIRVEYHKTEFLGQKVVFWDCGGQEQYRELYQQKQDIYFDGTDLLLYIIDIQDKERFEISLEYLDMILQHFILNEMDVPLIISFHKFDPELRGDFEFIDRIAIVETDTIYYYDQYLQQWIGHPEFLPSFIDNPEMELGSGYLIFISTDATKLLYQVT